MEEGGGEGGRDERGRGAEEGGGNQGGRGGGRRGGKGQEGRGQRREEKGKGREERGIIIHVPHFSHSNHASSSREISKSASSLLKAVCTTKIIPS